MIAQASSHPKPPLNIYRYMSCLSFPRRALPDPWRAEVGGGNTGVQRARL